MASFANNKEHPLQNNLWVQPLQNNALTRQSLAHICHCCKDLGTVSQTCPLYCQHECHL
jgi:uncharacterized protein CbrC (UPF0167 family)